MDLLGAVASGGASILKDGVMTAVQYYNQKHLNDQAQSDTQENMELAHKLNQKAQFNSIKNSTAALRAAGLNPALAVGGVQGAAGVSNPAGSAGEAQVVSSPLANDLTAFNTLALQDATKENLRAQTDKLRADTAKTQVDTKKTQQEVKHTESEDAVVNDSMRSFLTQMRDSTDNPFIGEYLDSLLANNESFDLGSLRGFSAMFFDFSREERERELDFIAKEVDKAVLRALVADDKNIEALARRPYDGRIQLYKSMALMDMQAYSLEQDASLTPKKKALLEAQANNLNQQTQSIYHNDPAAMWNAGDFGSYVNRLVNSAIESAASGAGFGAGAALGSRLGGSAIGAAKARSEVPSIGSKSLGKRAENGLPAEKWKRIQEKALQIDNPVQRAQYIDKAVRSYRAEHP